MTSTQPATRLLIVKLNEDDHARLKAHAALTRTTVSGLIRAFVSGIASAQPILARKHATQ